jgi:hypothetical protein
MADRCFLEDFHKPFCVDIGSGVTDSLRQNLDWRTIVVIHGLVDCHQLQHLLKITTLGITLIRKTHRGGREKDGKSCAAQVLYQRSSPGRLSSRKLA